MCQACEHWPCPSGTYSTIWKIAQRRPFFTGTTEPVGVQLIFVSSKVPFRQHNRNTCQRWFWNNAKQFSVVPFSIGTVSCVTTFTDFRGTGFKVKYAFSNCFLFLRGVLNGLWSGRSCCLNQICQSWSILSKKQRWLGCGMPSFVKVSSKNKGLWSVLTRVLNSSCNCEFQEHHCECCSTWTANLFSINRMHYDALQWS